MSAELDGMPSRSAFSFGQGQKYDLVRISGDG